MTAPAMSEKGSDLTSQCMAFCQALASKGRPFNFTLNVDNSFLFSLDTRGDNPSTSSNVKKKSPSTLRRNARRRAEFLNKKLVASTVITSSAPDTTPGKEAETVINQVEGEVPVHTTPEKERNPDPMTDLVLSPICGKRDDEDMVPSALPTLSVCNLKHSGGGKCGETFKSEKDLKSHAHRKHDYCIEHQYRYKGATVPICPAPGVPSGRCISMNLAYCRHKRPCICGEINPYGEK